MTKAQEVMQEIKHAYPDIPYYDDNKLSDIIWGEWGQVEERGETGDSRRWLTSKTTYWRFEDDSWLGIDWDQGNTEMQDSQGPYDIYLVEKYEEVTVVNKYRRIDG